MKIGIAGYGYVGQAHEAALKDYHEILIRDPALGHYADLQHADAIIICVSTPANDDGSCDYSNVYDIVSNSPPVPILIKSTISLEGWRKDLAPMNKQITFSPEFLTAANANEDFEKQNKMLFGGGNSEFWNDVFILCKMFTPVYATVEELIMTKYLRNSFLATKVAFFNEVSDLCKIANISYNSVKDLVGMDERITPSHMQVPGPDGELGFGGACFPKDTEALLYSAHVVGVSMPILHAAVKSNNNKRKD